MAPLGYKGKNVFHGEMVTLFLSVLVGLLIPPIVLTLPIVVKWYFDLVSSLSDLIPYYLWVPIPLAIGGLITGLIIRKAAPEAEGPGLHIAAAAYHRNDSMLRARTPITKYIATIFTVGSGGTNSIVSPSALIGYSLGSSLARRLGSNKERIRTLSLCGLAAAIAALFETPLGAAIFAVEVAFSNRILYKRFFFCLASSIPAYLISHMLVVKSPMLDFPRGTEVYTLEALLILAFVAVSVVVFSVIYVKFYQFLHDTFDRLRWDRWGWLKPVIGMGVAGIIMIFAYPTLIDRGYAGGYSGETFPLEDFNSLSLMLAVIVLFFTTSLIASSGGSGGLFMPVFAMGGITGLLISSLITDISPSIFAVAGISAALATTLNVPLASAIICMELFGPPAFIPAVIGSIFGYLVGKRYVIYQEIRWTRLKNHQ